MMGYQVTVQTTGPLKIPASEVGPAGDAVQAVLFTQPATPTTVPGPLWLMLSDYGFQVYQSPDGLLITGLVDDVPDDLSDVLAVLVPFTRQPPVEWTFTGDDGSMWRYRIEDGRILLLPLAVVPCWHSPAPTLNRGLLERAWTARHDDLVGEGQVDWSFRDTVGNDEPWSRSLEQVLFELQHEYLDSLDPGDWLFGVDPASFQVYPIDTDDSSEILAVYRPDPASEIRVASLYPLEVRKMGDDVRDVFETLAAELVGLHQATVGPAVNA